jgi:stage II sporulation protein P
MDDVREGMVRITLRWLHTSSRSWLQFWRASSPLWRNTIMLTLAVCLLVVGVSMQRFNVPGQSEVVPVFAPGQVGSVSKGQENNLLATVLQWLSLDLKQILNYGFPLLDHMQENEVSTDDAGQTPGFFTGLLQEITKVRFSDPWTILSSQLPAGVQFPLPAMINKHETGDNGNAGVHTGAPIFEPLIPPLIQSLPEQSIHGGEPRILIFHTHTSETFHPLHGESHIYDQTSGIVMQGSMLKKKLEGKGIPVLHDQTPHDFEVHREAYLKAVGTVERLLKEHPDAEIIIDLHRDAPNVPREESRALTTTEIDGETIARIMLVVGTNRLGLAHPNWTANHQLALQVHNKMETLYPGISRGVNVSDARYNQHLSPRMLLVELGGVYNTPEECERAGEILAEVLASFLAE